MRPPSVGLTPQKWFRPLGRSTPRKAWEYYVEEPLVKNCVNSWRTFAVGDEIKIAGDNDKLKSEATDAAYRLNLTQFI
jgi:hypothetical protein